MSHRIRDVALANSLEFEDNTPALCHYNGDVELRLSSSVDITLQGALSGRSLPREEEGRL